MTAEDQECIHGELPGECRTCIAEADALDAEAEFDDIEPIDDEDEDEDLDEQTIEDQRHAKWLDDLQEMVDFLDEHRDLIPLVGITVSVYKFNRGDLSRCLRSLGSSEKVANDWSMGARRRFGDHDIYVHSSRDLTCEQVETGETKQSTVEADARTPVPEGARNVRTITKTVYEVDEPVTEWNCPPSLLDLSDDESVSVNGVKVDASDDDEPF